MRKGLRIVVVDDHKILLGSFAAVLSEMAIVDKVDTCSTYGELVIQLRKAAPDVLFLDLNIPPYNGLTICNEIRKRLPDLCIVILTSYEGELMVQEAIKNGANAYFAKPVDVEVIERFLNTFYTGSLSGFVVEVPQQHKKTNRHFGTDVFTLNNKLTTREREIFGLLASGLDHTAITKKLSISYDTFKTHRSNILQKLELKSTVELVQYAMANGLTTVPAGKIA
jgi:DNA-binding NarL/FixJ family response regulator